MGKLSELHRVLREKAPELTLTEQMPLAKLTSFRIGGPAALVAQPRTEQELNILLTESGKLDIQPVILGAGTNVLAPDEGLDTLVICTRDCLNGLRLEPNGHIVADAGVTLARLASFACNHGLSGLEFAHGIPGTVGGGSVMNAGAYGGELRQVQDCTWVMEPDGTVRRFEGEAQGFGYRTSAFADGHCVVLRAAYCLKPDDSAAIRARMEEFAQRRRASQPLEFPSAGSTFKRPQGGYAAALIDQAGLKGLRVGGAEVSPKHAGFVVNVGGATAQDVKELMALVQRAVWETSDIRLEPEVKIL
jgi:UDP-N-acetylmuramate dehydrogenase